jgi:peptidoglycan hydrolase-like protein with peptidoglycan-binding domain
VHERVADMGLGYDDAGSWRLRGYLRATARAAISRPFDTIGMLAAATLGVIVLVNALWLQTERHPAPLHRAEPIRASAIVEPAAMTMPRPRPAVSAPLPAETPSAVPSRNRKDLLTDIQRELARKGFYEGPADGIYGPKMDAAIRDFEQAAKLKPSQEPSEALLQAITGSNVRVASDRIRIASATGSIPRPPAPIAVSPRITAIQRALAEYGYGQLRPTGVLDEATRNAIERFERERRLPVSGQVSERLVRELASVTGRPLE